ncbi:hypothetical protein [Algoriphagus sp. oki45]|uniref:hypothetical protein n=1 Tax=Algoriphagus sp. oki45 TaxID=3067294 RepID=UPI0030C6D699
MKTKMNLSKIILSVFQEFGIPTIGSQKRRKFYSEIAVDRFYVEGILFELETRLGVILDEEDNYQIQSPLDIIRSFENKLSKIPARPSLTHLRRRGQVFQRLQA